MPSVEGIIQGASKQLCLVFGKQRRPVKFQATVGCCMPGLLPSEGSGWFFGALQLEFLWVSESMPKCSEAGIHSETPRGL